MSLEEISAERGTVNLANRPRIFVGIASYRDRDCQWTVKDLFAKANHPERIFVGICWQVIAEEDQDCFLEITRPEQCRTLHHDARHSLGVCWARHHVQSLWQGEDYSLQIDAHMRFVQGWDDLLLQMLAICPSPRAVLSAYPAAFTPPDIIDSHLVSTIHAKAFDPQGILKLGSVGIPPEEAPPVPAPSPYCAAGFLFGPGQINIDVPYDPALYFDGEEISLAVRLWTHGWDIFAPNAVIAYHDYNNHPGRRRHWNDQANWTQLNALSLKRVRHLLGIEPCDDPEALRDLDRYGLGTKRSLSAWQEWSGVDFARRLIDGKNMEQMEAAASEEVKRRSNAETFGLIWSTNSWGNAETRSGAGSSLSSTARLVPALREACRFLDIHSLIDAGCGDMNWMAQLSEQFSLYFGIDLVEDLLVLLRQRFGRRRGHFFANLDITLDPLPTADAILCRDVLTHLPDFAVKAALRGFKASGARYLLATTQPSGVNAPITLGQWRAVDLTAPPFNLPKPQLMISEGLRDSAKALGVWQIADLPELPADDV